MTNTARNLTKEQRALLTALDPVEWRHVGYRLGPFHPWMANELVHLGLVERRPRPRKAGAFEYRRIARIVEENGEELDPQPRKGSPGTGKNNNSQG